MLKRFLPILLAASLFVGCATSEKTNPVVEEYLLTHIANPDSYKAGKTETYAQGTIDVSSVPMWKNIPADGKIDVVVLRHEFKNVDVNGNPTDNVFYFYMNPSLDVLYYAHKDKGMLLVPLD